MRIRATNFKDLNDLALVYCKVADRIISDEKLKHAYRFTGGRKGSQKKPKELVIHGKVYDSVIKAIAGDKANRYKAVFNKFGWIRGRSDGAKNYKMIDGKLNKVIILPEDMFDFIDELIHYSESGATMEERMQTQLSYTPPVLKTR